MMQCDSYEVFDVFVVKRIEDHLSLFTLLDEAECFKKSHLVRHCRLCNAKNCCDVQDAQLLFAQGEYDFQSRLVTEDLERLCQADNGFLVCYSFPRSADGLSMIIVWHTISLND